MDGKIKKGPGNNPDAKWELYNIKTDRCEMKDLALKYPDKVEELNWCWEEIAEVFRKGLKVIF